MNYTHILKGGIWGTFIFTMGLLNACDNPQISESIQTPQIIEGKNQIEFQGRIFPNRYNTHPKRAQGHHAIVWRGGGSAEKALIETDVSDREILNSLLEAGAVPGNNLPRESWTKRHDKDHPAPDFIVEGTKVHFKISWDGLDEPITLESIFQVSGNAALEARVGGHADQIDYWKSGCVLCMFSCPGGKVSNAGATIRMQETKLIEWNAMEEILPPDGTPVKIIVELKE